MRFRALVALYVARLRSRAVLVQELLAVVGIAVGVALLFASQVAATSLSDSVAQVDRQVIGQGEQFQLQARSATGFPQRLQAEVQAARGVQSAVAVLEEQVNLLGPGGARSVDLVGLEPSFSKVAGPIVQRFAGGEIDPQHAIALPEPLAEAIGVGPLQPVTVQMEGRDVQSHIAATLSAGTIGAMVNNPVAIAPLAYVQALAQAPAAVTRIFVGARPADAKLVHWELQAIARGANVNLEPASFDSTLFSVAVAPDSKSEALFSAISALVGFVFALNAMLITVPSRRRLIQELRPHGASLVMIVRILAFDAFVLAFVGCLLGLLLGDVLSVVAFRSTPGYLAFAFPVGNNRIVTTQSVVIATLAGFGAAVAGVFWPLRDSINRSASAKKTVGRSPILTGVLLTVGAGSTAATLLILLADTKAAVWGDVALLVALLCLLPFLFDLAVGIFHRAQAGLGGAAGRLASVELRSSQTRVRSLAISATAAVALFGTVEFGGIVHNLSRALDDSARGIDSMAPVWVTARGEANAFATTGFTDVHRRQVARVPGVSSVGVYRGSFLDWGKRRLWVLAPASGTREPIPSREVLRGNPATATARLREGGWAVLSEDLASEHDLKLGEAFTLPAPRPRRLRLAAVVTNLGWAPGAMILSSSDYAHAWASAQPSAYQLQLEPGASPEQVRSAVEHSLGPASGLVAETSREREHRHFALAGQGLARLSQIRLLVLIAALLAVTGAVAAMIWQRRDLVAFIKCDGYPRGILLRWLVYESAVLLAVGSLAGAGFGLYGQVLGSHFLADVTGFPITFDIEVVAAIVGVSAVTLVAVAVIALPGYLVVRVPARTVNPGC